MNTSKEEQARKSASGSQDARVIFVEDDDDFRHALMQSFDLAHFNVSPFVSAEEALSQISRRDYCVVVSDIRLTGMNGLEFLQKILDIDPAYPVILITGHGSVDTAVEAMQKGAYDFVEKPFPFDRLKEAINRALEKRRLVLENRTLRDHFNDPEGLSETIVGSSDETVYLRKQVEATAGIDVDVLVFGETGSGKEVVSRALHDFGDRANSPFVALNCGAVPKDMIESELFGHMAGAFTGATKKRVGKLEYAQGGTVFLDEIESMPMDMQIKLLRVIENRTVQPLGSNQEIPIDVRFIAATKEDLLALSEAGRFRADLFYRLNVVSIDIPPLRDRLSDIPELVLHFQRQARAKYRRELEPVTQQDLLEFSQNEWPGNVRELRNEVDRVCLGIGGKKSSAVAIKATDPTSTLHDYIAHCEEAFIRQALEQNGWSMQETFKQLEVSRKTLHNKMSRYGISKKDAVD